jgi:hypothetical protein
MCLRHSGANVVRFWRAGCVLWSCSRSPLFSLDRRRRIATRALCEKCKLCPPKNACCWNRFCRNKPMRTRTRTVAFGFIVYRASCGDGHNRTVAHEFYVLALDWAKCVERSDEIWPFASELDILVVNVTGDNLPHSYFFWHRSEIDIALWTRFSRSAPTWSARWWATVCLLCDCVAFGRASRDWFAWCCLAAASRLAGLCGVLVARPDIDVNAASAPQLVTALHAAAAHGSVGVVDCWSALDGASLPLCAVASTS